MYRSIHTKLCAPKQCLSPFFSRGLQRRTGWPSGSYTEQRLKRRDLEVFLLILKSYFPKTHPDQTQIPFSGSSAPKHGWPVPFKSSYGCFWVAFSLMLVGFISPSNLVISGDGMGFIISSNWTGCTGKFIALLLLLTGPQSEPWGKSR